MPLSFGRGPAPRTDTKPNGKEHMRFSRIATAAVLSLAAVPAMAQVQQVTPNYKVVEHGRSVKVANYGSYNPDCSSIGRATINLMSAPQGGTVETANGHDYPVFTSNNVRFQCDKRSLPSTQLYYRAAPNFTGTDTFTVEVVFSGGEARQYRYTVYVR